MTIEEKAKAYDEALEDMRVIYPNLKGDAKLAVEHAFPELAESEDERIRKQLIDAIKIGRSNSGISFTEEAASRYIAWLEKQKERGPLTKEEEYTLHRIIEYLEDEICPSEWVNLLHDIYCLPYQKQKEPHYTKRNALFDKCVENCDPKVMKEVSDEIDEMLEKEQKPAEWSKDIVESIATWATEKLQVYSMKESTPYVEAVKNNAQKVLTWAKEQWPIYFGWKPSEEQLEALKKALHINPASGKLHELKENEVCILQSLLRELEKLM